MFSRLHAEYKVFSFAIKIFCYKEFTDREQKFTICHACSENVNELYSDKSTESETQ